jgi:starch synthase
VLAARSAASICSCLDAPHLFGRPGNPYVTADGRDWPDNAFRFGALGLDRRAYRHSGAVAGFRRIFSTATIWQAGLAMAYLAYGGDRRPATVLTVHNLAYQGQFPGRPAGAAATAAQACGIDGVEHLRGHRLSSRRACNSPIASPPYRRPMRGDPDASGGCGLDGLLRARAAVLYGICNGIDVDVWNPETDTGSLPRFSRSSLAARSLNKAGAATAVRPWGRIRSGCCSAS